MAVKYANNATSTLASSITATQTTLVLAAGTGARFPALGTGDKFYLTLIALTGDLEIVVVTARTGDSLTVIRAHESTSGFAFPSGSYVSNNLTAEQYARFYNPDNDGTGSGLDADLLNGHTSDVAATPSTVPLRDTAGVIAGNVAGKALGTHDEVFGYFGGVLTKDVTGAVDVTLTLLEMANGIIIFTGAISANINVIFQGSPIAPTRDWILVNKTTGLYTLKAKSVGGTGVLLGQPSAQHVYTDGTDLFFDALPTRDAYLAGKPTADTPFALDSSQQIVNTSFFYSSLAGSYGSRLNLVADSRGLNNYVTTVSYDYLVLKNAAGQLYLDKNVSGSANINNVGVGGLDTTSTLSPSSWYYLYRVMQPATSVTTGGVTTVTAAASGFIYSSNAIAPTLPAGYTFYSRVRAERTDASAQKYLIQTVTSDYYTGYAPLLSSNTTQLLQMANGAVGGTPVAIAWANFAPPTTKMLDLVYGNNGQGRSGGDAYINVYPNNQYGTTPAPMSSFSATGSANSAASGAYTRLMRVESANIYWTSGGSGGLGGYIYCAGWEDAR